MATPQYDDGNLQRLFAELDIEKRQEALKGAFRREANNVRRTAIKNLRSSIRSNTALERGIRVEVFKRKAGFRVTIGTKVSKAGRRRGSVKEVWSDMSYHKNSKGRKKPVLIWAEAGTEKRHTRYQLTIKKGLVKGHYTGSMKRYGFMQKTAADVRDGVTDSLHNEIIDSVKEVAKKYGCT